MKIVKSDYKTYLNSRPDFRFAFIDPPWRYGMEKSKLQIATENATKYEYWGKDNRTELLNLLDTLPLGADAVFIWTTNPMLEATMDAIRESKDFRFRTLLTWEKTTVHGNQAKVMAHYFQNCTEFVVFAVRNKLGSKINRTNLPTHFSSVRGKRTVKPKEWEAELVRKLGGRWAYIFSGPMVEEFEGLDIELVDSCHE